jgi:GT2 family glycosyltransferase
LHLSRGSFTISPLAAQSRGSQVSVVIAAFNASKTLNQVLRAIEASSLHPLEIIVVDDCSSDDTVSIARHHGCKVLSTDRRSGPARARNLGSARAQGDVLVFLDSDVRLHPDALRKLVAHLDDEGVGAAFGAYDDDPLDAGFCSRYRNLLHCHTHRVGRSNASTFWAGLGVIRRDLFLAFGGFDESYDNSSIEDIEFGMRLTAAGVHIRLDPDAQAQHLKRWTFRGMSRTDIVHRGIPWTRLILKRHSMPNDLNLRWSQRVSVAAAWIALAAAATGHWVVLIAALAAVAVCNWRFLSFLRQHAGWSFAIRAFPIHFVFSGYCGLSLAAGTMLHLKSVVGRFLQSPQPNHDRGPSNSAVPSEPEKLVEAPQEIILKT